MQPIALQIRRDTEANWNGTGTILRPGEQSYSTDTNVIKVGDGVSTWTALPPISGGGSSTSPLMTDNFMVAGGDSTAPGTDLAYSYDGLTWVSSPTNIFGSGRCYGLAWNGSIWLAVGTNDTDGIIASSPDGITWTVDLSGSATPFSGLAVSALAWNGSLWVAGGRAGTGDATIAISTDGKTWVEQASPFTSNVNAVAANGNMFVAAGKTADNNQIAYSYDGITWVKPDTSGIFFGGASTARSVAWNGQIWVVGGADNAFKIIIATSPDGIIWTQESIPGALAGTIYSVAWNGSLWMAGGGAAAGGGAILTSPNGTTWTDITGTLGATNPFVGINTVSWNGARWFLGGPDNGGDALLLTSPDAITWTSKNTYIANKILTTASRRPLPYMGEAPVTPLGPSLSLSYYLSGNTGANTGPNAISVIGFNTPDPSNSVTGGALDMTYSTGNGVLTNTSSKTISVLVSGQVTTDNTAFDLARIQPCLYVTKNSHNIVSSSVLNFNGSSFSTIVILGPAETITIRYTQTSPYNPVIDVSGVRFLGGQFSTRITFTQMKFLQGPSSGGAGYFSGVVRSSLIPDKPSMYDLGSTGYPFHSLHVTGTTIYLGQASIKEEGGTIQLLSSSGTPSEGPTGAAGPYISGTTIVYGTDSPTSGTGQLGDTYVKTDTAVMYSKEEVLAAATWVENTTVGTKEWASIACSASGQYVAAVVVNNKVYTNNNYGHGAWTEVTVNSGGLQLISIASDSTGQYLAAVDSVGGASSYIYTNSDYGNGSWTQRFHVSAPWISITSSSSGTNLTAVSSDGIITTSTNSGSTWSVTRTNYGATFADIAYNSMTTDLITVMSANKYLYLKTTISGAWNRINNPNEYPSYRTVKVVNIPGGTLNPLIIATTEDAGGTITYTGDGGTTWSEITISGSSNYRAWASVAAGNNGQAIFAVATGNPGIIIYSTTGPGTAFTVKSNPTGSLGKWSSIACNEDGSWATIADQGNYIYTINFPSAATELKSNITASWTCVAIASDFDNNFYKKILATATNTTTDASGGIYLSTNGTTFSKITSGSISNAFTSVTVCGTNGSYGAAAVGMNDYVYVSTDGTLTTWSQKTAFGKHDFVSIASYGAANSMSLVATDTSGNVWYSTNAGTSWSNICPTPSFSCVTSNAGGSTIAATDAGLNLFNMSGDIWISNNSGVTWSAKNSDLEPQNWSSITYESFRDYLWAAASGGSVYSSTSSDPTFQWQENGPIPSVSWTSINSSAAIETIVLTAQNTGSIWVYDVGGWTEQTTAGTSDWRCSAISSDGSRIIVGSSTPASSGPLWRYVPEQYIPTWQEQIDIGAVATYNTANNIWGGASTNPPSINDAINRMAAAYYTKYLVGVPLLP